MREVSISREFIVRSLRPLVLSLVVLLLLQRGIYSDPLGWQDVLSWMVTDRVSFLVNWSILSSVGILGAWVFPRALFEVTFLATSVIFTLLNHLKVQQTLSPVLPSDLFLLSEHFNLLWNYASGPVLALLVILGLTLPIFLVAYLRKLELRQRRPISLSGVEALLLTLLTAPGLVISLFILNGNYSYDPTRFLLGLRKFSKAKPDSFERDGVPFTWLTALQGSGLLAPPGCSNPTVIDRVLDRYSASDSSIRKKGVAPDILMIMVESWMDPGILPSLQPSRDPMTGIRAELSDRGSSGRLVVPVFALGTPNTEFEVLTGIPASVASEGAFIYNDFIHAPVPSIVHQLNQRGYESYALHNFQRRYWSRNLVYPWLGFKRYFSLEDLGRADPRDWRPDDSLLVPKVQELLSDDPGRAGRFVFVVTMSMHGPYDHKPFRSNLIEVRAPWASNDDRRKLSNYLTAQESTLKQIGQIVSWVRTRKRPTVVIAFGDHLPGLIGAYRTSGLIHDVTKSSWTAAERSLMYETPWFAASNFGMKPKLPERLNAFCLGQLFLESVGVASPDPFFRFVSKTCRNKPDLLENGPLHDEGFFQSEYGLLAYDRIFGIRASYRLGRGGLALAP